MEDITKVTNTIELQKQNRKRKGNCKSYKNKPETDCDGFKNEVSITSKRNAKREYSRHRMAQIRLNETPEQYMARLERARVRAARVRNAETPEQRIARLERARKYKIELRMNETLEQRNMRLESARKYKQEMRQNETPQQRNARLEYTRRYMSEIRKNRAVNITLGENSEPIDTQNQITVEIDIRTDDGNKDLNNLEIQNKNDNKMKDMENILNSKEHSINNNVDNTTDIIIKDFNGSPIKKATNTCLISGIIKPEPMPYNVQDSIDFQLNSITGNILPLEEEVEVLLQKKNNYNQQNQYECSKCNKKYRYAHSLKKHLNVHDNIV